MNEPERNESQQATSTDALQGPSSPQDSDMTPQDASTILVTEVEGSSSQRQQVSQEKTLNQSKDSKKRKSSTPSTENTKAMKYPTSEGEATTGQRPGSPSDQPPPAFAQNDSVPDLIQGSNVQLSVSMTPDHLGQGEGSPGNHLNPRELGEELKAIVDGSGGQPSRPGSSPQANYEQEVEMEGIRLSHEIPLDEAVKAEKECCDPARRIKKPIRGGYGIGADTFTAMFWNQLMKRTTVFLVGTSNILHLDRLIKSKLLSDYDFMSWSERLRAICLRSEENVFVGERELIQQLHKEKQEGYSTLVIYLDLEGHSLLNTSHQMGHLHVDQHAEPSVDHLAPLALRVVSLIRNVSQHATYSLYLPPLPRIGQETCAACVGPEFYIVALNRYERQLNKAMKATGFQGFARMSRKLYLKWIIELLTPGFRNWVAMYGIKYFNTKLQQICGNRKLQKLWFLPQPLKESDKHGIREQGMQLLHHGLLRVNGEHYYDSTLEAIWVLCSSVIQTDIDKGRCPNLEYTRPYLGNPAWRRKGKAARRAARKARWEQICRKVNTVSLDNM